jgi:Uma2 family endonuclease
VRGPASLRPHHQPLVFYNPDKLSGSDAIASKGSPRGMDGPGFAGWSVNSRNEAWRKTEEEVRVAEALKSPQKGRVTLRNVSWETYERLMEEDPGRSAPRFFYDWGMLEIVSPSFEREQSAGVIASLVGELVMELEIDMTDARFTTFNREDLSRGFEPDVSFYFSENASRVRGKQRIGLDAGEPPPDLVVEVDITSLSASKLPIYARLGVAEVWRHDGTLLAILGLLRQDAEEEGYYAEIPESISLAPARVPGESLTRFVEEGLVSGGQPRRAGCASGRVSYVKISEGLPRTILGRTIDAATGSRRRKSATLCARNWGSTRRARTESSRS